MSFLGNIINEFTHKGQGGQQGGYGGGQQGGYGGQQGGYGGQQGGYGGGYGGQQGGYGGGQQGGRPNPPPPWVAEWDNQQNRWIFINTQNGQRTHEFPQGGYGQQQGYGGGYQQQQQGQYGGGYQQQQQQKPDHSRRNMALGVGAGLLGGAALMYEGHEIHEDYEKDKYRAEEDVDRAEGWAGRKFDNGVQDVEDFPDDAARWTGEKVQEVEDIPDDIAHGVGDAVGDVERFDDGIDNAYDAGRDEQRYDDDSRNDGW